MEIGLGQADDGPAADSRTRRACDVVRLRPDLQGIPRVVVAQTVGVHNARMSSCLFCRIIAARFPRRRSTRTITWSPSTTSIRRRRCTCSSCRAQHVATLNDLGPQHDALVGEMVRRAAAIAAGARLRGVGLSHGVQLQCRRRPDGVSHPPARARRPKAQLAAGVELGSETSSRYAPPPVVAIDPEIHRAIAAREVRREDVSRTARRQASARLGVGLLHLREVAPESGRARGERPSPDRGADGAAGRRARAPPER